ncbi:MAG TPA: ABC transporter permease [Melioribacteraceae bacterium]|nr:ABC transporter permease [Melioribacteraceae bacterium]
MLEFFIAKRYIRSKHKLNFITIISFLSTAGITIGVAALIIVLSVFNGFGSLVKSILISFDPHVRISVIDEGGFGKTRLIEEELNSLGKASEYYPFVEGKVVLLNRQTFEIVTLKGVAANNQQSDWGVSSKIISGNYDLDDASGVSKIILGLPLALKLSARVGDTINAASAYNIEKTITSLSLPRTQKFVVTGLFESNNRDYDIAYSFTSLKSGQRLFGLRDRITGYEVRLDDIENSGSVKIRLNEKLPDGLFSVNTWYDLHKDLFSVMLIERWAAYILLCLIIAVATFNIFASLTMTVLEKKKDIGIMRSIGLTRKSILKIFMLEGLLVGMIGTILGILIGIAVCYIQIEYNFYPLDPSKYIIDSLPVELRFTDIIAVGLMAMFLSFIASLYPARRAANTMIIDSIKYE